MFLGRDIDVQFVCCRHEPTFCGEEESGWDTMRWDSDQKMRAVWEIVF